MIAGDQVWYNNIPKWQPEGNFYTVHVRRVNNFLCLYAESFHPDTEDQQEWFDSSEDQQEWNSEEREKVCTVSRFASITIENKCYTYFPYSNFPYSECVDFTCSYFLQSEASDTSTCKDCKRKRTNELNINTIKTLFEDKPSLKKVVEALGIDIAVPNNYKCSKVASFDPSDTKELDKEVLGLANYGMCIYAAIDYRLHNFWNAYPEVLRQDLEHSRELLSDILQGGEEYDLDSDFNVPYTMLMKAVEIDKNFAEDDV